MDPARGRRAATTAGLGDANTGWSWAGDSVRRGRHALCPSRGHRGHARPHLRSDGHGRSLQIKAAHDLDALRARKRGAGRELGAYVHISGETGVGAGIVVAGELLRGAHGAAGEIGHVIVDPGGALCRCGMRGCLEQVVGQDPVLRTADVGTKPRAPEPISTGVAEPLRRLESNDDRAHRAVRQAGEGLGTALVAAVNLLDPAAVVLGGLHARLAPWLIPHVRAALDRGGSRTRGRTPDIRASALAAGGAVRGAAGEVVARVLADPLGITRDAS
ncbi:ROK family protein [Streptodolium elevatio]|uniref:ROK family protein n=1 Tax=Streptodolium elevatio TaxID=3157996 RepID=A0ABV3DR94_9ACTN